MKKHPFTIELDNGASELGVPNVNSLLVEQRSNLTAAENVRVSTGLQIGNHNPANPAIRRTDNMNQNPARRIGLSSVNVAANPIHNSAITNRPPKLILRGTQISGASTTAGARTVNRTVTNVNVGGNAIISGGGTGGGTGGGATDATKRNLLNNLLGRTSSNDEFALWKNLWAQLGKTPTKAQYYALLSSNNAYKLIVWRALFNADPSNDYEWQAWLSLWTKLGRPPTGAEWNAYVDEINAANAAAQTTTTSTTDSGATTVPTSGGGSASPEPTDDTTKTTDAPVTESWSKRNGDLLFMGGLLAVVYGIIAFAGHKKVKK